MHGKIKFYNSDRGFGFIIGEDSTEYFFHIADIKTDISPEMGQSVKFVISLNNKGMCAKEIYNEENQNKFFTFGNVNIRISNIKTYGIYVGSKVQKKECKYRTIKKTIKYKNFLGKNKEKIETRDEFYYTGKLLNIGDIDVKSQVDESILCRLDGKKHSRYSPTKLIQYVRFDSSSWNSYLSDINYGRGSKDDYLIEECLYFAITTYQGDTYVCYEDEWDINEQKNFLEKLL